MVIQDITMSIRAITGSRNYYGEYSLEQWINLMLNKEIILPDYQRAFVWTEEDVRDFINCLENGLFVPPVTIGNYGNEKNYILDGQQRLSAILIAYLNLFPQKGKFQIKCQEYKALANENDDLSTEEDVIPLEWNFSYFTKVGRDKHSIVREIDYSMYKSLEFNLGASFWRDSYIGFSLVVPISDVKEEQQMLYSSVFRNINVKGRPLSNMESRKSLYFLRENFDQWFSPGFAYDITINSAPIDFVRYLSLLSQYKRCENVEVLAQTYKTRMEKYYESYILSEVNDEDEPIFTRLLSSDNETVYKELDNKLHIEGFPREFPSIIDADTYLFGLIYYTIAERKIVSITDELISEINTKVQEFKNDPGHTKSPSAFKHLRRRVQASLGIYRKYLNIPS